MSSLSLTKGYFAIALGSVIFHGIFDAIKNTHTPPNIFNNVIIYGILWPTGIISSCYNYLNYSK